MSPAIRHLLDSIVVACRATLGDNLVGVYLHGSLAMGCFNPRQSDVDFLVVVRSPLALPMKRLLAREMIRLSDHAPPKGLEMSVVTLAAMREFVHPAPFEFHFGHELREAYAADQVDLTVTRHDPDLAAHVMITRQRGRSLCGPSIHEVFADVPAQAYRDSIVADSRESYERVLARPDSGVCPIPLYAVLNFCRVLAYVRAGLITSKREGGQWALRVLPDQHHPVIREALIAYAGDGPPPAVEARELKAFAKYAGSQLGLDA